MKLLQILLWVALGASLAVAQPVLIDPPDFSDSFPTGSPDAAASHPGSGCFWLASGEMMPGDVDWIQILIPFDTGEVIVDVDITSGSGSSNLFVSSSSGTSGSNNDDGNSAFDQNCGGSGLATDSVVRLGVTPDGAILGIGISGGSDGGFAGNHSETFNYDVYVHAIGMPAGCTQDTQCDDGVGCTVDVCDLTSGACMVTPDDTMCDDGVGCTDDVCDLINGCQSVANDVLCDDLIGCTTDACDVVNDCTNTAVDSACDDGVGCTHDICDLVNDCQFVADDSLCDDSVGCTVDTCDAVIDCQHELNDAACDDGVGCTVDSCDAINDCQHQANDAVCDNGLFCDGQESCHVVNDCQGGPSPCFPGDTCDEVNGCLPTIGLTVEIDINPGSCPNRLNRFRRGFFRVALTGTSQLASADVDRSSLLLTRADGVGQSLAPFVGGFGPKFMEDDVIGMAGGQACFCHAAIADGELDLIIPFELVDAHAAFMIDAKMPSRRIELVLTGSTFAGDSFAASDCVYIFPLPKRSAVSIR